MCCIYRESAANRLATQHNRLKQLAFRLKQSNSEQRNISEISAAEQRDISGGNSGGTAATTAT
jgi:hypothetical protein